MLYERVARQALRTPSAPAVTCGETLTYEQLIRRADELSVTLTAAGVQPGDIVGVLMRRSADMVITLLALLRAGAAYVGVDPDDPPLRRNDLLTDAGAQCVVADDALRACVPDGFTTLSPTVTGSAAVRPPGTPASTTEDDLAYVSFTSGSTGRPKGVMVPHGAVLRLVTDMNWMSVRQDDVFLQAAPLAFDASTFEIWAPLTHGCHLVVAPAGRITVDGMAETVREHGVTVAWLTAGLFHEMVAHHVGAFAGVRHLVAGGDVIQPGPVGRLLAAHPGITFTNGYGPTENTTFTTTWTTDSATGDDLDSIPIGTPVNGTRIAVLDSALRPVEKGACGELYVSGAGLAHGYLGQPGATADRFVPDPFASEPGARMYRTGDLVRLRPDGACEFVGRVDDQVKILGHRVEPVAVETALHRLPNVSRTAVVVRTAADGTKRLVAYVVPEDVQPPNWGERLREQLRATLPTPMIPWAVLVRDTLPLTGNGKIDRSALPVPDLTARNVPNEFVSPRTDLEHRLAELWQGVLGVERIGADDDFFDLGGHSLNATELLVAVRTEFGVTIPARVLYLQPTLGELGEQLENALRSGAPR
ncbi:non-ribosomal peptide synthetase [Streptomyces longispororuber]|uniref:non-ribosomal peptide synthetase n=1 Tax=Streptomyces longispororuber TaxID=68230 RepID=UPI0021092B80|nr:non-ribosomal peptide synthetase [Streptomyces longispororuber]MCQ4207932.1 non-ribosomal peptide synthetase [Streptomyces longispororuber]